MAVFFMSCLLLALFLFTVAVTCFLPATASFSTAADAAEAPPTSIWSCVYLLENRDNMTLSTSSNSANSAMLRFSSAFQNECHVVPLKDTVCSGTVSASPTDIDGNVNVTLVHWSMLVEMHPSTTVSNRSVPRHHDPFEFHVRFVPPRSIALSAVYLDVWRNFEDVNLALQRFHERTVQWLASPFQGEDDVEDQDGLHQNDDPMIISALEVVPPSSRAWLLLDVCGVVSAHVSDLVESSVDSVGSTLISSLAVTRVPIIPNAHPRTRAVIVGQGVLSPKKYKSLCTSPSKNPDADVSNFAKYVTTVCNLQKSIPDDGLTGVWNPTGTFSRQKFLTEYRSFRAAVTKSRDSGILQLLLQEELSVNGNRLTLSQVYENMAIYLTRRKLVNGAAVLAAVEKNFLTTYNRFNPHINIEEIALSQLSRAKCNSRQNQWIQNCFANWMAGAECHSQWMTEIHAKVQTEIAPGPSGALLPPRDIEQYGMILARNMGNTGFTRTAAGVNAEFANFGTCSQADSFCVQLTECKQTDAAGAAGPAGANWAQPHMSLLRQCYRFYGLSGAHVDITPAKPKVDSSADLIASYEDIPISRSDGAGGFTIAARSNTVHMGTQFTLDNEGRVTQVSCSSPAGPTVSIDLLMTWNAANDATKYNGQATGAWANWCFNPRFGAGVEHRRSLPLQNWAAGVNANSARREVPERTTIINGAAVLVENQPITSYTDYIHFVADALSAEFPGLIAPRKAAGAAVLGIVRPDPIRRPTHNSCLRVLTKLLSRRSDAVTQAALGGPDEAGHVIAAKMTKEISYQTNSDPINFMPQPPVSNVANMGDGCNWAVGEVVAQHRWVGYPDDGVIINPATGAHCSTPNCNGAMLACPAGTVFRASFSFPAPAAPAFVAGWPGTAGATPPFDKLPDMTALANSPITDAFWRPRITFYRPSCNQMQVCSIVGNQETNRFGTNNL